MSHGSLVRFPCIDLWHKRSAGLVDRGSPEPRIHETNTLHGNRFGMMEYNLIYFFMESFSDRGRLHWKQQWCRRHPANNDRRRHHTYIGHSLDTIQTQLFYVRGWNRHNINGVRFRRYRQKWSYRLLVHKYLRRIDWIKGNYPKSEYLVYFNKMIRLYCNYFFKYLKVFANYFWTFNIFWIWKYTSHTE